MPRKLYLIEDITTKTEANWSAKIQVLVKYPARSVANSPRKYQKYIFADKMGTRVQAIIWGNDINLFDKRLHVFKAYYISRATVKSCAKQYQIVAHPFEWVIHGKTVIEECDDNNKELEEVPLHFAHYSVFRAYLNSPTHLDIMGILMDMDGPKKVPSKYGPTYVQEAIIINQELKPIMVAFWDSHVENECVGLYSQQAQNPVIVVFRAKVVPYNGMSLSIKNSSGVVTNPEIPAAFEMRQWFDENKEKILASFNPADYYSTRSSPAPTKVNDLKTLADGIAMPENTMFWTKATITIVDYMQRFYYVSCSNCPHSSGFDPGETYLCNYCGKQAAIATPRYSTQVQLKDPTAILQAQVYAELAESLIGCTAWDLSKISTEGEPNAIRKLIKLNETTAYLVQIKGIEDSFEQNGAKKYTIYQAQPFNDSALYNQHLSQVSAVEASSSTKQKNPAVNPSQSLSSMDQTKEARPNEILDNSSQPQATAQSEN